MLWLFKKRELPIVYIAVIEMKNNKGKVVSRSMYNYCYADSPDAFKNGFIHWQNTDVPCGKEHLYKLRVFPVRLTRDPKVLLGKIVELGKKIPKSGTLYHECYL